ncbi:MAG: hypothetical protein MUE69_26300 [Myxococcota bacterium]|jgi:hypothetical protein|nr:hypothetical protein [Myxococcota bacterium]
MTVLPHEDTQVKRLERMPLTVQRKLVEAVAHLEDADWRGLPRLARQRLVDMQVDSAVERRAFRQLVAWLRETFLGAPCAVGSEPPAVEHPWRASQPPPGVDASTWNELPIDLRYALVVEPDAAARVRMVALYVG